MGVHLMFQNLKPIDGGDTAVIISSTVFFLVGVLLVFIMPLLISIMFPERYNLIEDVIFFTKAGVFCIGVGFVSGGIYVGKKLYNG